MFSVRDHGYADADALLRRAVERRIPLLTTNLVVPEVHRLLLFRAGRAAAAATLARIDESRLGELVFASKAHHVAAREWLTKLSDQQISYADAVSFAVMRSRKCRVALSFDHDFWVAGFELWQASE